MSEPEPDPGARRPLHVRNVALIQKLAKILSQKDVTPNQISLASIGFAALAGVSCIGMGSFTGALGLFFERLEVVVDLKEQVFDPLQVIGGVF